MSENGTKRQLDDKYANVESHTLICQPIVEPVSQDYPQQWRDIFVKVCEICYISMKMSLLRKCCQLVANYSPVDAFQWDYCFSMNLVSMPRGYKTFSMLSSNET